MSLSIAYRGTEAGPQLTVAREQRLDLLREHFARKPSWLRRCVPRAAGFGSSLRAKKYQFLTRFASGPKFWVFKARSPRMNVGFFNRYKPQVGRANLNSDRMYGKLTSTPSNPYVMRTSRKVLG